MDEEERPNHVVYDCVKGEATVTPVSDEEWAEIRAGEKQHEAEMAAAEAKRADIRAQVAAHPDPLVQLLAQEAGLA